MVAVNESPLVAQIKALDLGFLEGDLIQPGHRLFGVIWINRERHSGEPCFYATRVPIFSLFNVLEAGDTLDQFLDDFEGVTREQALAVLRLAKDGLLADLPKT
jgi:uncharacterized protein (DUF433 family)